MEMPYFQIPIKKIVIKFFEGTATLLKQPGCEELVGCKWIKPEVKIGPILTCSIPLITLSADLLGVNAFHLRSAPQINYYAFKFVKSHRWSNKETSYATHFHVSLTILETLTSNKASNLQCLFFSSCSGSGLQ